LQSDDETGYKREREREREKRGREITLLVIPTVLRSFATQLLTATQTEMSEPEHRFQTKRKTEVREAHYT